MGAVLNICQSITLQYHTITFHYSTHSCLGEDQYFAKHAKLDNVDFLQGSLDSTDW